MQSAMSYADDDVRCSSKATGQRQMSINSGEAGKQCWQLSINMFTHAQAQQQTRRISLMLSIGGTDRYWHKWTERGYQRYGIESNDITVSLL